MVSAGFRNVEACDLSLYQQGIKFTPRLTSRFDCRLRARNPANNSLPVNVNKALCLSKLSKERCPPLPINPFDI